jgi:hypothetical protein
MSYDQMVHTPKKNDFHAGRSQEHHHKSPSEVIKRTETWKDSIVGKQVENPNHLFSIESVSKWKMNRIGYDSVNASKLDFAKSSHSDKLLSPSEYEDWDYENKNSSEVEKLIAKN